MATGMFHLITRNFIFLHTHLTGAIIMLILAIFIFYLNYSTKNHYCNEPWLVEEDAIRLTRIFAEFLVGLPM